MSTTTQCAKALVRHDLVEQYKDGKDVALQRAEALR